MPQHVLNWIFPAGVSVREIGVSWGTQLPLPMLFCRRIWKVGCFPHRMGFYGISVHLDSSGEDMVQIFLRAALDGVSYEEHNVTS
jgi:hypothetical protein